MKRKPASVLARKQATVAVQRGGLSIQIDGVPADEAAVVAAELLRALRELSRHFDELVPDAGSAHASPIEGPDDEDGPDYTLPPSASPRRPMGFS